MTRFLLIRHGAHDLLGRVLAGRMPGVRLNAPGQAEATQLVARLAPWEIRALYSSPLERTLETAAPLAAARGLPVQIDEAFHEIDFGTWTGRTFAELHPDPEWTCWNTTRSQAQPPGGETMGTVQARFVAGLNRLAARHENETVALFSHGDPLKAFLFHVLGAPLDNLQRLELEPASIAVVESTSGSFQITHLVTGGAS